nr:hypothetical protein [Candidatus Sigynarchaeota archaeon]
MINAKIGGVFDSWGDDFLDRFNESINGVNSTRSFTIYRDPDYRLLEDFDKDLTFNLEKPLGLLVVLSLVAVDIIAAICLHPAVRPVIVKKLHLDQKERSVSKDIAEKKVPE